MGSHLINMNCSAHKVFLLFGASLFVSSMVTLSTASKIYHERTIEIGVVVDKFLWQTMKEQSGGDDFTAEKNMKSLVNNGDPIIWKTDSDGDQAKMTYKGSSDVYSKFSTWIYNNPKQKGDNDLMIFLSGAHHKLGLSPRQDVGRAGVDTICNPKWISTLMVTITLENKSSADSDAAGKLLAHEIGHGLGANHDGKTDKNTCPEGTYIMSPSTTGVSAEWSECSRKSIDEAFNKREENSENCFYT